MQKTCDLKCKGQACPRCDRADSLIEELLNKEQIVESLIHLLKWMHTYHWK